MAVVGVYPEGVGRMIEPVAGAKGVAVWQEAARTRGSFPVLLEERRGVGPPSWLGVFSEVEEWEESAWGWTERRRCKGLGTGQVWTQEGEGLTVETGAKVSRSERW